MTAAARERIIRFSNGVLTDQNYCVERVLFLNYDKTKRLLVGKTLVEGKPMLYVIAQISDSASHWYTDQMFFSRKANDVVNTLQKIWNLR